MAQIPIRDVHAQPPAPPPPEPQRPPHVRRVVAVASGKGGVGKSSVAVGLACALARSGLRVGLADADIFGPSAPKMLGVSGKPLFENGQLVPFVAHGVKVMSIGFIASDDQAMIFRGPRLTGAARQMIGGVNWASEQEPLDILFIDLPPGTGDVHLTVIQMVKLDGVVLVTTPQEIALIDARRGATMFEKTGTPILGLVENMAYFPDPSSGRPIPIFGAGGGVMEAERLSVPLLAQVPIDIALREGGDRGSPVNAVQDGGPAAAALDEAAHTIARQLELG